MKNKTQAARDGIYFIMGGALGAVTGASVGRTALGIGIGAALGALIDELLYRRRVSRAALGR